MAKEKEPRKPFNLKKELKLAPGYIILLIWVIFTIVLLGWVFCASFSTTPEIFQGKALKFETGLHFENYAKPGMAPVWQYSSGTHFYTLLFPVRC